MKSDQNYENTKKRRTSFLEDSIQEHKFIKVIDSENVLCELCDIVLHCKSGQGITPINNHIKRKKHQKRVIIQENNIDGQQTDFNI